MNGFFFFSCGSLQSAQVPPVSVFCFANDGNTEVDRGQAISVNCCGPPNEQSHVDFVIATLLKFEVV